MKRLSWMKARKLKKLGYFKLPKTGHPWVGSPYTWARIWDDGKVMPYSDEYLATTSIQQLAINNLYWSTRSGDELLADDTSQKKI
ncbi:hypothetical protein M5W78_17850 [Paenibacillus larvae]|uniref:hypothetical protein n=1 Tax=Paenibacillus larvae TaxID=1464 RepID=UPI00228006B1|nr:hypothetical protein [Paenibacillus larvae]MCY9511768.1 hypothetical protein [Paenibacillus larvae]